MLSEQAADAHGSNEPRAVGSLRRRAGAPDDHVLLQAQRQMRRLRRGFGVRTLNMAASVGRWQTLL